MRTVRCLRRALAALLLLLLPLAAHAQTTTFGADCSSQIAETNGGLALQTSASAPAGTEYCRASTPKYSGKWYFEVTMTSAPNYAGVYIGFGLGNNGTAQPVNGGLPLFISSAPGNVNSVLFLTAFGGTLLNWDGATSTSVTAMATGKTGAIAVDLDSDSPEIWATADVTGTGGYSGGPVWNGSTTASPLVPGSGIPTTGGTGLDFLLPGAAYFPIFAEDPVSGYTTGQMTFNFGASAFVGTVPSGYSAWNSAGGAAPDPGPTHPMTINVANAPAWHASVTYVRGDRVLAGPAWNGSAYTSGQPLYLWALTGGYGGTSGTSAAAFNACPSPANYGGGLLGNEPAQWLNATHVSDGALTWTCLTPVDYTTFTAMAYDSPTTWAPSTTYYANTFLLNGGNAYFENVSGSSAPCTSASTGGGPSGTGTAGITDGTCTWWYVGAIPYSSEAHRLPHQTNYGNSVVEPNLYWNTTINLWYGGAAAPLYQDGVGGESDPLLLENHYDYIGEFTPFCYHGYTPSASAVQIGNCNGAGTGWIITLQPAPGDGFADNATPGVTPFGYPNSAYGVEIYSDSPFVSGAPYTGNALTLSDSYVTITGLQFLATQGMALPAAATGSNLMYTAGNGHGNGEYFNGDIFYAGGSYGVIAVDASAAITNSTIVYNGPNAGCFGVWAKFNPALANDTIIGPGSSVADCAPVYTLAGGNTYGDLVMYDNALFGWSNPLVYGTETGTYTAPVIVAANNATDIPSSYTAGAEFAFAGATSPNYYPYALSGVSLYGLSGPAQFVNPTPGPAMDLRLLPTGSLYGGGAAFSYAWGSTLQTLQPGPGIFGNARPQGTRYDIGAYQVSLGCPSPAGAGCH